MNISPPLVSFCVIAYKEEKYIRQAIQAAFDQDYPNMEIILSDDGSPDNTFNIMKEMADEYKGPHKIILNRNESNLGPRDHYCKVLYELSHGEIIVLADGDDISLPTRTSVSVNFLNKHPEVTSLSFKSALIDENNQPLPTSDINIESPAKTSIFTLTDYIKFNFYMFSGDSRVLRRNVINAFPPLKYSYSEDVFLFIRSLYIGSIAYIREPLVLYRQRPESIMGKSRQKTKITKEDIIKFKLTTQKQLKVDLDYAISSEYISKKDICIVTNKIQELIKWLRPKNKTFVRRCIRKLLNIISTTCYKFEKLI